jgi:hypothetical protein
MQKLKCFACVSGRPSMKGTVFRLKMPGSHYWVIISDNFDGRYLGVNITDVSHAPHSPCKIGIGEHPVISKTSCIVYKRAMTFEAEKLKDISKFADVLSPCDSKLLNKIIEGAFLADDLTASYLKMLR